MSQMSKPRASTVLFHSLDPLQSLYYPNYSINNIITTNLHLALTHLDTNDVQIMLTDLTSAFEPIISQQLNENLSLLGLGLNHIIKFTNDTTRMVLITQSKYREGMQWLANCLRDTSLSLNIGNIKC